MLKDKKDNTIPIGLCFVLVIGTVRSPTLDCNVLGKM